MIPEKQLEEIKEELIECQNPFFFFHDDTDGLCSFLQMYKFKGEGKWHMVKPRPFIDESFARFVPEDCDKIFILDIAVVEQEFIDRIKKPVVWIDHHSPLKLSKCRYFNPRIKNPDVYTPVSAICYEALKEDLLIGAIGTIGDLGDPSFMNKFLKEYKSLVGKCKDKWDITFKTKFGELIRILEFNLKGKTKDIKKSIRIFMKTKDFTSFLSPKSSDERYIYARYDKINEEYREKLEEGIKIGKKMKKGEPFIFIYREKEVTLAGELGKEIPYRVPNKKIYIICREKSGRMLCSLRSRKINLVDFLEKAFKKVDGYGGGHPVAVGCNINKDDFEKFIELAKEI
jgi:single-stranded DNA-specific DHH superfamily exonuclease